MFAADDEDSDDSSVVANVADSSRSVSVVIILPYMDSYYKIVTPIQNANDFQVCVGSKLDGMISDKLLGRREGRVLIFSHLKSGGWEIFSFSCSSLSLREREQRARSAMNAQPINTIRGLWAK